MGGIQEKWETSLIVTALSLVITLLAEKGRFYHVGLFPLKRWTLCFNECVRFDFVWSVGKWRVNAVSDALELSLTASINRNSQRYQCYLRPRTCRGRALSES